MTFHTRFKTTETTMTWNCIPKALCFLKITAEHQDILSSFKCFCCHKNFIPKYRGNALLDVAQTSRKLRQVWEEQTPRAMNTAASKIDNEIISLLWRLHYQHNIAHNQFPSFCLNAVVSFFHTFVNGNDYLTFKLGRYWSLSRSDGKRSCIGLN